MDAEHWRQRFTVAYRVMQVSRVTGLETRQITTIVNGGTIERNQDTAVTESGSLEIIGNDTDFGHDLLRIYADLAYEDGSAESVCLGTFIPSGTKRSVTGSQADSTPLDLYGRLRELDADEFTAPVSLAAGKDPLPFIEETIRECGLEIAPHVASTYRLGSTWTFGMDDSDSANGSKLAAVNDLLTLMDWNSARTDVYGRVVLAPYVPPKNRAPSWDFVEGAGARFLRTMEDERDWFDTKNQIVTVYSSEEIEIRGLAQDTDPRSMFSIPSRGYVISETYRYSDVPEGKTVAQLQVMADAKAHELLATAQAVIRRVTFTHIYAPIGLGDVVRLDYPSGGVEGDFAVRTQRITLGAGLPTECEARSFTR